MKNFILMPIICILSIFNMAYATNTAQEKAITCSACHGPQGISFNPEWPNLAGQHAAYLLKQLQEFKQGKTRNALVMTPMVAALSEKDMQDLATFYSTQAQAQGTTPEKYKNRGEQLYKQGDRETHITACIACHGPAGTGNEQAGFPVVSGQHAKYIVLQLQAFKDKKRSNDLNAIMRDISARMTTEDMQAVAHYMEGLKPIP